MKTMYFHFKRTCILSIALSIAVGLNAQWTEQDSYNRPLSDVLVSLEKMYGVKLIYENKNIQDKTVAKADWKMFCDVETTLDNILLPLELRSTKKGNNTYEIKKWEHFRKPYEEGARHLKQLLSLYPDKKNWETRRELIKQNIYEVMGLKAFPKGDLNPVKSNFRRYDSYTVENIALEILPGVWVCGSLYMPEKTEGKIPAFLSPHGHFYNNIDKSIPNERGRYRPDQQIRCGMLARMGVAVFSYDMFAWGESALAFPLKDHRTDISHIMQTWQSIRVLDFLYEQPWVDKQRIGVTGASGGGSQTMVVSAIDDRITLSVPTVMTASHFFGGCPCESGMPIHFIEGNLMSNNAELAAIMAPKPLLVISDGNDWTETVPYIEYPYIQTIYGFYGKKDRIGNAHFEKEKHDYGPNKRQAMYDFVAKHFKLNAAQVKDGKGNYNEKHITIEPATEMYVFGESRQLPANALKGLDTLRTLINSYKQ